MAATYADALKKIKDAGLYDQTSEYDKGLLVMNPTFADNIVKNKTAYMNATSDAERKSANDAMNADRAYYGGYTGGTAGMDYYPTGNNTYGNVNLTNIYSGSGPNGNGLRNADGSNMTPSSTNPYGDYKSNYQTAIDQMLGQPYESKVFRYNYKSDPTYKGMLESYRNNGELAGKNTLARLAAATGGAPSTYAVQAATAAQAQEMDKLANYIPQLQQNAWNQYVNDRDFNADQYRQRLNAITNLENRDYDRFVNANDEGYKRDIDYRDFAVSMDDRAYDRQRQAEKDAQDKLGDKYTWALRLAQQGDPSALYAVLEEANGKEPGYIQTLLQAQQDAAMQAAGGSGGSQGSQRRRRNPTPANPTPSKEQNLTITNPQRGGAVQIPGLGWFDMNELEKLYNSGKITQTQNGNEVTYRSANINYKPRT